MQYNDIEEIRESKEIRCLDCGHLYRAHLSAISSSCMKCGNLAYHPVQTKDSSGLRLESEDKPDKLSDEIMSRELSSFLGEVDPIFPEENNSLPPDHSAILPADSKMVDAILLQNQQEWQLWAQLVQHFRDENNHQAYLSFVAHNLLFERAIDRYTKHRKVHLLIVEERWQAEMADQKLEVLGSMCLVQLERSEVASRMDWSSPWLLNSTGDSRHLKPGWSMIFLAVGLFVGAAMTISLML